MKYVQLTVVFFFRLQDNVNSEELWQENLCFRQKSDNLGDLEVTDFAEDGYLKAIPVECIGYCTEDAEILDEDEVLLPFIAPNFRS